MKYELKSTLTKKMNVPKKKVKTQQEKKKKAFCERQIVCNIELCCE